MVETDKSQNKASGFKCYYGNGLKIVFAISLSNYMNFEKLDTPKKNKYLAITKQNLNSNILYR
jgi:type II secretory pathway component PulL